MLTSGVSWLIDSAMAKVQGSREASRISGI